MASPLNFMQFILGAVEAAGNVLFWANTFGFEPRAISPWKLGKMTTEELTQTYNENFERAVRYVSGDKSLTWADKRYAVEKCVTVFDRLSELDGGAYGNLFRRDYRKQLQNIIRQAAKGVGKK